MKRRAFITALGGAAAWPLAGRAQQPALPVIGLLDAGSPDLFPSSAHAFLEGLSQAGYVRGKNVAIEYRWAEGQNDRLPALASDLVRHQVTAIAVVGTPAALAAKAASATVPIVFAVGSDPVEIGLVASLSRPGGNLTGVVTLNVEIAPKRLELLHELFPSAATFALLVNPTSLALADLVSKLVQAAARTLGIKLHVLHASSESEFDAVCATAARLQAAGLVVGPDPLFNSRIEQLAALTAGRALPAVYQYREFAAAGGLMSYGSSVTNMYRQVGVYTGRILKGKMPADLPVEQTTKIELFVNLRTAKALGLDLPPTLLARADEVLE